MQRTTLCMTVLMIVALDGGNVTGSAQTENGCLALEISGASGRSVCEDTMIKVWFWVAPATGPVAFDTRGSDVSLELSVFTFDPVFTTVALLEAGQVRFTAQKGVEYTILARSPAELTGTIVLNWRASVPPANAMERPRMLTTGGTEVFLQSVKTLSETCQGVEANYEWSQVSGPRVYLVDSSAEIARFTAPSVDRETTLIFSLAVGCPNGVTASDTVPIRVITKITEKVLSALVDFTDVDASERPFTRQELVALLDTNADSLKNFISETSRHLIEVDFDILDWITVNKKRTDYPLGVNSF